MGRGVTHAVEHGAALTDALAAYRAAEEALTAARNDLHDAIRRDLARGVTAYRLSQLTGLSQRHVGRLR